MSRLVQQTTFNPAEMERLAGASPPRLHALVSPPRSPKGGVFPDSTTFCTYNQDVGKMIRYDGERFDSGFESGGLMSIDAHQLTLSDYGAPDKPTLILSDTENIDSGYGKEEDMEVDDVVEPDRVHVAKALPPPVPVAVAQPVKQTRSALPRRPVVNHLNKTRTGSPPLKSRSKTSPPPTPRGPASLPQPLVSVPASPSLTAGLHSLRTRMPDGRRVSPERLEIQKHMHYFLPNKDGDNGIHLAVIHSRTELLNRLLYLTSKDRVLKSAIDEQNTLFQTPLHLATHTQQTDMIRKLIVAGSSINITDHKGNTPLHIACKFSSTKCLDEMLRFAPLKTLAELAMIRNNDGLTCVHVAAVHSNRETLRKLKTIGADLNVEDFHSGKTALHMAVERDSLADVCLLVESCEVDINAITYSGCTALHIAAGRGNIALVAYLLSMGTDPDVITDEGDSALDLASSEQVQTLLTKAAAIKWLH